MPAQLLAALLRLPAGSTGAEEGPAPLVLPASPGVLSPALGFATGAWPGSLRLDSFVEISPADNAPPRVKSVAYLIRDDRALVASIHLEDPDPHRLRAPLVDRDKVFSDQDFVQLEIDVVGDGRTSRLFRVNPRGVQADGIYTEATGGDDFSPDFAFESWTRQAPDGWMVVLRIPLASLPSPKSERLSWRVCVYRNYPREFRHQFASNPIPRGSGCWLCHARSVGGDGVGHRTYLSLTPYVNVSRNQAAGGLEHASGGVTEADAGFDLRFKPSQGVTLDGTFLPDFSQIESDVVQLDVNARFALRYPEKRPFFMEGADLFDTPIPAAYTRSISTPRWGVRATGNTTASSFAVLLAQDRGGGSVVIPGSTSSELAPQDFESIVALGRLRRTLGTPATAGLLVAGRQLSGSGHNWVVGPDVDWRPNARDQVLGQALLSFTRTPNRPDLHTEWDGQALKARAIDAAWNHLTRELSWNVRGWDYGGDFRADTGFLPQVDQRGGRAGVVRHFYPEGWLSLIQPGLSFTYLTDGKGSVLERAVYPSLSVQGRFGLVGAAELHIQDRTRVGTRLFEVSYATLSVSAQPSRLVPKIALSGRSGEDIDVVNERVGRGGVLGMEATVRPSDHVGLELRAERRWLDVANEAGSGRLFTGHIAWMKATYSMNVRCFLRLIAQYERVRRNLPLYAVGVSENEGGLEASTLFGCRANWRTLMYLGYGQFRTLQPHGALGSPDRQVFFKLAYEFGGH